MAWRRNWKFVSGYAALVLLLVGLFGGTRVTAIATGGRESTAALMAGVDNVSGRVDLFDDTKLHTIELSFDPVDYERMLSTFRTSSTKDFIEADLRIDGTLLESVGLRLKGNSTLFALRGGRGAPAGGPGGAVPGGAVPGGGPVGPGGVVTGGGAAIPGGGAVLGGGLGGATANTSEPEKLPWLIQFDEFVSGRRYQGQKEISIRPIAGSTPATALNEALALKLVGLAGEPTERSSYSSFAINGSAPSLRLVVEQPGDEFAADNFDDPGVLYKTLSTGAFVYRGEDPLAYTDSYRQITGKNDHDLQPMINLLRWVSESSDAEFAENLARYVDIESFARYVALQNLLLNFDDIAGPGQNGYWWYNLETKRFSVVSWDMNFALSGNVNQGPFETAAASGAPS